MISPRPGVTYLPIAQLAPDREAELIAAARAGIEGAFESLVEPLRRPLFAYIYRMVTHRDDAEDLLQDTLLRAVERLRDFRGESSFKTWLFGIATHVCLDHLRAKKRWRLEAQLIGEQEADADPDAHQQIYATMTATEFKFEIREHVAFCFSCVSRTLEPEEQAAIMLKEVLGFTNQESAHVAGVSEPVFRHRLADARSTMANSFDGLCRLIHKTGACWQCEGLRSFVPEQNRGADLVQIQLKPGVAITAEALLDARLEIVRGADLETGASGPLHTLFFAGLTQQEEGAREQSAPA